MDIESAKDQIKNAMTAYFTKSELGDYVIPIERQRPIFLMGPPGIGKTAVMEQIAQELGVGLVAYSMTHHTRQSALGLPFIVRKNYGGREYDVSEYTMSEIIASVYDMMEDTGLREGILFLDEVNCVSETLAPAMLQFLQFKTFGRHRVPDGWIVVTAGNPPEYNKSVREFDIVTWDRLKRIDVEPDFDAWKAYAYRSGTHPAIMTYLEIKRDDFYKVETTVDGKAFVTARGWDDLSAMIKLYEQHGLTVDENVVSQYLQNQKISKDFAIYYDLFNKYKSDYKVETILAGEASQEIRDRAKAARFDERLSLLGLLLDATLSELRSVVESELMVKELLGLAETMKVELARTMGRPAEVVDKHMKRQQQLLENAREFGGMSDEKQRVTYRVACALEELNVLLIKTGANKDAAMKLVKAAYDERVSAVKEQAKTAGEGLSNLFRFAEDVWGDGQEILILVTELTISYYGARFISQHGSKEYFEHNKELLFYERQKEIIEKMEQLEVG